MDHRMLFGWSNKLIGIRIRKGRVLIDIEKVEQTLHQVDPWEESSSFMFVIVKTSF